MGKRKLKKHIDVKEKPSDIALKCLLQSFIVVIITMVIMRAMAFPLLIHEIFFGTIFIIGMLLCYTYSRIFRYVVYGTLLVIGTILILQSISGNSNVFTSLTNTVSTGSAPSIFILIGLNIFFYLFVVLFPSFLMCFLLTAGIVIGLIVSDYGFPVTPFIILLCALYAVYMLERNTSVYFGASSQNKRMITTPPKMTFRMIISYLLIYVLLTTLSIGNSPLLGDYSDQILNNIRLKLEGWFSSAGPASAEGSMFSISSMGFGKSGELGGDVVLNNKHVLTVYSDYVGLYLGGAAYENYNGRKWSTNEGFKNVTLNKSQFLSSDVINEKMLGVNSFYPVEEQEGNYETVVALVKHEKELVTQSMFTFSKTESLNFSMTLSKRVRPNKWQNSISSVGFDTHEKYRLKEAVPSGGAYEVTSYNINYDSPNAEDMFIRSFAGLFKFPPQTNRFYDYLASSIDIRQSTYQLGVRAEAFYDRYLQLPENLPSRVIQLAHELTDDIPSNYDKARAIERYLNKNYTYTLTPGSVPKGKDFVDYFLFETKEGYCSYYATAMTILLRCVGIPARYVEGFVVTGQNMLGDGGFKVLGANAHAWPEVYFEGIGFIEFEPTSPYAETSVEPVVTPTPTTSIPLTPTSTPTPTSTETPVPSDTPDASNSFSPTPSTDPSKKNRFKLSAVQLTILLIILSIIALVIIIVFAMTIKHKMFRRRALKDKYSDSVKYIYKRIERILGWYHIPRDVTFTLPEYEDVLFRSKIFDIPDMKFVYNRATVLFNKARYSGESVTESDAKEMLTVYEDFIAIEKERIGLLKYFIHRYILGKI